MSKKTLRKTAKAPQTNNNRQRKMSLITLGKPEPILTSMTDYQKIWYDNDYDHYTLPIDRLALAQLTNMNGQHGGVLYARHNMIASDYLGGGLTHEQFKSAMMNFLIFGDVALLKVRNFWGDIVRLEVLPSLYLRRRKDGDFVVLQEGEPLVYSPEEVIFIKQYDPQQQVYGLPDYIGGIHAALLNSEATIFRRRYYHNGAHTGGIIYTNDPNISDETEDEIIGKLQQSKGIGNFETMFVSIPNGDPDGIKFIPVGDISANDEFANVKSISSQDVLTAHRFPAGLAGIIPTNVGGLGDPEKARDAYRKDEVIPVQNMFMNAINSRELPEILHIRFQQDNGSSGAE
ncbi:phage portal protein [Xenorhabdus hominickii]|uniref:Phage portal protein n=1 Tax=Xenorhabdus hominickii TaxID=351679 RepID=A0A2G0QG63_XENHO|nr:phage portal protein [Xenorhabdus hominickii]AOM42225.1 phage portal protein [Xenorhabdus hominickii]PHM58225.1 phage portal protein [Xenorhabdus hominickii]